MGAPFFFFFSLFLFRYNVFCRPGPSANHIPGFSRTGKSHGGEMLSKLSVFTLGK